MESNLTILKSYDIPLDSYVQAVCFLTDQSVLSTEEYVRRITELTGSHITFEHDCMYRYHYLYLVQEIVRASQFNYDYPIEQVHQEALNRTYSYVQKNPWIFSLFENGGSGMIETEDGEIKAVKPKVKRSGEKKQKAITLWKDLGGVDHATRKEWIAIFMEQVGMTSSGASTYYQNLKSGLFG